MPRKEIKKVNKNMNNTITISFSRNASLLENDRPISLSNSLYNFVGTLMLYSASGQAI